MRALTLGRGCEKKRRKLPRQRRPIRGASRLERVRGKVDFFDRLERISSQTLLDCLKSHNAIGLPAHFDVWRR